MLCEYTRIQDGDLDPTARCYGLCGAEIDLNIGSLIHVAAGFLVGIKGEMELVSLHVRALYGCVRFGVQYSWVTAQLPDQSRLIATCRR